MDLNLGMGEHFDEALGEQFYKYIRNGILHQAEIKGKSRLRIKLETLVQRALDGEGLVLDRRQFHQALVEVFERYLEHLRDPGNEDLRAKFRRKMDAIVQEVL